MASRKPSKERRYEKRLDRRGRTLWYSRVDGELSRVARPKRFQAGDRVLDLTADAPTLETRVGRKWDVSHKLPKKLTQYWVEERLRGSPSSDLPTGPFERARELQLELIASGRVKDPDRIRIWQTFGDGRSRRFTVSSWTRFMAQDRYAKARAHLAERDADLPRYVIGLTDRRGDLGEELEELEP